MPELQAKARLRGGELCIGLSRAGIALLHRQGRFRPRSVLLDDCRFAPGEAVQEAQIASALDRLLTASACQGMPTRVVLADQMVRHWMVTPPKNAAHILDCQAAAEARFQTLFGEPMADWAMAADWQARTPFMSSALPKKILSALQAVCADHRLLLVEVVPEFVANFNRCVSELAAGHWFGLVQDRVLTLAVMNVERLSDLRSIALPPQALAEPDWLRLSVEREATRLMRTMPVGVQLCGDVPPAWLQSGGAAGATGTWTCSQLAEAKLHELAAPTSKTAPMDLFRLAAAGLR